jgi:rod shape-determining protein MreD
MIVLDTIKAGVLLLAAAIIEVSILSWLEIADAHPELALVLLVCIALLRGPIFGACAGFWVGLALDTASLEALGVTSLLLTLAGYWCGRLGEVTTRSSAQPPLVAVAVAILGVGVGSAILHFMLGQTVPVSHFFVGVLLPALALNLLLAYPVYRLARALFPPPARERRLEVSEGV